MTACVRLLSVVGCALALDGGSIALAGDGTDGAAPEFTLSGSSALAFDPALTAREPDAATHPAPEPERQGGSDRGSWGQSDGHWWLTLGGGAANNFKKDTDYNLHVALSTFIAKDLEFAVELGGWYFAQEGTDTGGVNPNMVFRWHFLHDDHYDWTIYGDAGIGLLFAFDDVPDGGTSFDFTPRLGVGYTQRLDADGTRLQIGVRYHHISNARIEGDAQNPGRDSVMIYAGIVFPL